MRAAKALSLITVIALTGCPKKPPAPEEPVVDETPAQKPVEAPAGPQTEDEAIAEITKNFQRVHFQVDSTDLVGDSLLALEQNAKILNDFPGVRVEVQGHADERGTTDYNLALGQRRANIIKERLERMGVSGERITLKSFGEERPLADGSDPGVWSQNRRAEFRVLRSPPGVPVQGSLEE